MTKSELIDRLAQRFPQLVVRDAEEAVRVVLGAMTDARMKSFFDKMVKAGVVDAKVDYKKSYTLQFVNKGVGVDLRPKP